MGRRKAQSLSEYGICVAIVLLAIVTMQIYIRRGLQGRYHDVVRETVEQVSGAGAQLYEPYYLKGEQPESHTIVQNKKFSLNIQPKGRQTYQTTEDRTIHNGTSSRGINCYD